MGLAHLAEDAGAWPGLAAEVPAEWFAHFSWLHGVRHTQRVHIHARRLVRELCRPEAGANVALSAALWHDIGRVDDEWDPQHGARSVAASWISACTSRRRGARGGGRRRRRRRDRLVRAAPRQHPRDGRLRGGAALRDAVDARRQADHLARRPCGRSPGTAAARATTGPSISPSTRYCSSTSREVRSGVSVNRYPEYYLGLPYRQVWECREDDAKP